MFPFIPFRHIPRRGRASLPGRRDESGSGGRHHPRQRAARCRWLQGPTSYCTPSIIFRNSAGKKTEGRLRVSPRRTRPGPGGRGRAQPLRLGARLLADALHKTGPREAGRNLAPPRPAPEAEDARLGAKLRGLPSPRPGPRARQTLTVEVNAAVVVLVPVLHQGFELLVCHVLPGGSENLRQLLGVDVAVRVPAGV